MAAATCATRRYARSGASTPPTGSRAAVTPTRTTSPGAPIACAASPRAIGRRPGASARPTSASRRCARSCARPRHPGQHRDQGPRPARDRGPVPRQRGGSGPRAARHTPPGPDRRLVQPGRGGPLPRAGASIDTAPGIGGAAGFLLGGQPLPAGSVAMQMPIRFTLAGETLDVTTTENVARAHASGYAWQTWLSGTGQDAAGTWRTLLAQCVDGIMTARPRALERVLVADGVRGPGRRGSDPCAA